MKSGSKVDILLDRLDRDILNIIQSHFPISPRPYLNIAKKLGLTEKEVLRRVKRLKEIGVIRRIGASFDSRKMGFTSTLCTARVPQEKLEAFVDKVNSFPGVTHNYLREHEFNVWFTFIGESTEVIDKALKEIEVNTGVAPIYNFPATKMFKIKVDFAM